MSRTVLAAIGIGAGLVAVALVALLGRATAHDVASSMQVYWPAPEFALVDQTGDTVRTADLRDAVWLASFVFTHCHDVCPAISGEMSRAARALRRDGLLGADIRLVSFTVDPERDTPDVLRAYAEGFGGAAPSEWAFLTGVPGDSMRALIQNGFKLSAMTMAAPGADYQVLHSPRVVLVDRRGDVRGIYDATSAAAIDSALVDARTLARS
jgi:protein SCO1/2